MTQSAGSAISFDPYVFGIGRNLLGKNGLDLPATVTVSPESFLVRFQVSDPERAKAGKVRIQIVVGTRRTKSVRVSPDGTANFRLPGDLRTLGDGRDLGLIVTVDP